MRQLIMSTRILKIQLKKVLGKENVVDVISDYDDSPKGELDGDIRYEDDNENE